MPRLTGTFLIGCGLFRVLTVLVLFQYIQCVPFETAGRNYSREMTLFSQLSYLRGINFKGIARGSLWYRKCLHQAGEPTLLL